MACGVYKCIQIVFIICNFLGILMGIAMVAVGAYLYVTKGNFLDLMPKYEDVNITAVMIAAGIIVFVVSFIGFCGAWMESQCLLILYFAVVFVIFALEIAVGIVGLIYKDDIDTEINKQLKDGLQTSKRWPTWDAVQSEFKCCGVDSKADWSSVMGESVPDSCCTYEGCGQRPKLAYDRGCYTTIKSELREHFLALGIAGIVLGILQIINLVISMVLVCAIRRSRNVLA